MIKSPKQLFNTDPARRQRHADMVNSMAFHESMQAAFAQFCMNLPGGENPSKAWDANSLRHGAVLFMQTLDTLAEDPKKAVFAPSDALQEETPNARSNRP